MIYLLIIYIEEIKKNKKNEFIIWINNFKNVNKSNWYVIISIIYKKYFKLIYYIYYINNVTRNNEKKNPR
jgi:hypothetical protein